MWAQEASNDEISQDGRDIEDQRERRDYNTGGQKDEEISANGCQYHGSGSLRHIPYISVESSSDIERAGELFADLLEGELEAGKIQGKSSQAGHGPIVIGTGFHRRSVGSEKRSP
mmetsp:Transcript_5468/g.9639  ORF Transcript_5468/g.9639 Transcript_5468/m.9639 type:complete len:115 (+) Transcript_5468:2026-2370(+)